MIDFIYEILKSVIINISTYLFIALATYCVLVIKYSGITNWIRQCRHPLKRVFEIEGDSIGNITRLSETLFKNVLSYEEREIAVKIYASRNNSNPFNGTAIRLDDIEANENRQLDFKISKVEFFDFLSTNLSVYPANSPIISFRNILFAIKRWWKSFELVSKVKNSVNKYGPIKNFSDVIRINSLANIITVSILIVDSENRIGIVQRSKKVAISSGHYSVTAAGTLAWEDFESDNPFLNCIKREVREELNLNTIDILFEGVIISKQKLQPVFCFSAKVHSKWEDLVIDIRKAKDFSFETNSIYAVPTNRAIRFVAHTIMTDASAYQIWKYVEKNFKREKWIWATLLPIKIKKYEILTSSL